MITNLWRTFSAVLLLLAPALAQGPAGPPNPVPDKSHESFQYSFTFDAYFVPNDVDYGSPVFAADRKWLHLEARYNDEDLHTGSLWAGYNFSWGKKVQFAVTPMLGAVFGRINGFAPGCEASISFWKIEASITNEYVITPGHSANSFYYSWPEITYSPVGWLRIGAVGDHTKAFQTALDVQRGFLVGVSHKKWEATTYVFNPELTTPTVVLEFGIKF